MTQINLGQDIQIYKLKFKDRTKPTFEIKESKRFQETLTLEMNLEHGKGYKKVRSMER